MVARSYRDLFCWQLSNDLKRRVYAFSAKEPASKDFARHLEFARASLIETQNHLDDALDLEYLTADEHADQWTLADRAIGATTKLHQYLQTCKMPPRRTPNSRTPNSRTPNKNEP
jgi:hypothetical protein